MNKKVDVVIIGAGSAGLSALREVKKETSNYLLVDRGVLGTKCARVGCMPSKALLYAARDFSRRKFYERMGISGCEDVNVNIARLLGYVREVRDGFADSMVDVTKNLAGDNLRIARAKIIGEGKVKVDDDVIECKSIILAAGSSPKVPGKWMEKFGDKILTSDNIFEQEDLPRRIALIGLGTIGLEIGQSLSRLGVEIAGFDMKDVVGNITDPDINLKAIELL